MLGEHQKENAALAITALIELNERQIIELDFNKNDRRYRICELDR